MIVDVAEDGAAHVFVYVLIAVIIQIGKRNSMALLEIAEPAGGGDILKPFARVISKHAVGNNRLEVGIAGPKVEVQKSVIVEIPEIRAHREEDMIQAGLNRDISEGAIVVVMIKSRPFGIGGQAQVIGANISD